MVRKKLSLSLRRPAEMIDPLQAERFVRGVMPPPAPASPALDVEISERPDVQTPRPSSREKHAPASKSTVYRKRTDDHRRRMTIYLPEDLSRRLRLYAAETDLDYSEVLAEALKALLDRKNA